MYTKPVLSPQHRCLAVWDTKEVHPDWLNFLIEGYVDSPVSDAHILEFLSSSDEAYKRRISVDTQQRMKKIYAASRHYHITQ